MRLGLLAQRLRAARDVPERRTAMLRSAVGENAALLGWAVVVFALPGSWLLPGGLAMAAVELAVPLWAERTAGAPCHPHHTAERYGLFTLIVLGESVFAATHAVRSELDAQSGAGGLAVVTVGGLLLVFSMWWVYFAKPGHRFLTSSREGFVWGYGHYAVYASVAAVGAGLAVSVDHVTRDTGIGAEAAGASVAVPVALFLGALWVLHVRPQRPGALRTLLYPLAATLVLAAVLTPWPVLTIGLVMTALVVATTVLDARPEGRADPRTGRAPTR